MKTSPHKKVTLKDKVSVNTRTSCFVNDVITMDNENNPQSSEPATSVTDFEMDKFS